MNTILSVIPPVLVIVLALSTRNIIVSLFSGIVLGSIILNGVHFIPPILDTYMTEGLKSNTNVLLCIVLVGIMLQCIKRAGGFKAFGEWCNRKLNTPKKTAIMTFWFSILFSASQNLANLCVPRIMKNPTLKNKMPIEKVPLIVTSTVDTFSSLMPFAAYILFFSGLIVSSVEGFDGYAVYIQAIPFQFFAILSLIMAFLYVYGIIPDIGPIKKLAKEARERPDITEDDPVDLEMLGGPEVVPDAKALLIPFAALILSIPLFSFLSGRLVVTAGILIGSVTAVLYASFSGHVKFNELTGVFVNGFRDVVPVYLILLFAFTFGQVVNALGFSTYIIGILGGNFTPSLIPFFIFLICCLISYTTGSLSAAAVIIFPLGLPLALAAGISIPLTVGACISGSHFGDIFSPISDAMILPSEACGVSPADTSRVLAPYRLIQLVICAILYLIFGIIMA